MTRKHSATLSALLSIAFTLAVHAAQVGSPAPDFNGTDSTGKAQTLDQYRGKYISDIASSKNYVTAALTEAMAGQPVQVATTRPCGCSVKYAH
jgi:hypothetical protein